MTTDDTHFRANGKFKKGHPGFNKPVNPPEPPPVDAETDIDAAVLFAASSFGTTKKPKTGLAGYAASLRDTRPQDFAVLVKQASARRAQSAADAAAHIPITIEVVPCPSNYFIPYEEAAALWTARLGDRPVLVVDNEGDDDNDIPADTDTTTDTDDDQRH